MLTETEKAYIAGFLDGEGCFTVCKVSKKELPGFSTNLQVVNTNKAVLQWLQDKVGGKLYNYSSRPSSSENRKPIWHLYLFAKDMRELVKEILPFLKVKREVAELVSTFPKRQAISLGKGKGAIPDLESYQHQLKVLTQIRKLNKRGL